MCQNHNPPPCEVCLLPLLAWQCVSFPPPPPHVLSSYNIRKWASWCGHEFERFFVCRRSWSQPCVEIEPIGGKFQTSSDFTHDALTYIAKVVTEQPSFRDPSESLHDTNSFLNPFPGLQSAGAWVRRRKVAVFAQPVLQENRNKLCILHKNKHTRSQGAYSND